MTTDQSNPQASGSPTSAPYETLSLYIDGQFLSGDGRREHEVIDPATGLVFARLPLADRSDLEMALTASARAFSHWRTSSPIERSRVLRKVAELSRERAAPIGRNITREMGKPLADAISEVRACAEHCEWHAEECRRIYGRVVPSRSATVRQLVLREPIGVCAAFTPWNFPYNQAIRKIAAAIGAGCSVIIKGPEDAPSAVIAIARMFHEAGLPPGVLNVVWGVPAEVSSYLIESPIVRKISFTGSVAVGKRLAALAGANMKAVTMELGGHAPALVFDDADIEAAADALAKFKYWNAGQVCVSPSRMYVQSKAYDRFMAKFIESARATRVGNGLDDGVNMGPLASERRLAAMDRFVADAHERGGTLQLGGTRLGSEGFFYSPSVVTEVGDDALLMTEEPFGPIAPCVPFHDIDEVLARANSLPFGLAAYGFTRSGRTARALEEGLEAGLVCINHFGLGLAETPFGGVKDSGLGREGGQETFDSYLTTKFVSRLD